MSTPSIIFGLSEFPRPPKTGYFYHKLPPKSIDWNVSTITILDLYNVDENYQSGIFQEGIKAMLSRECLSGEERVLFLKTMIMTVNAGHIPNKHWTQDSEIGGGRVLKKWVSGGRIKGMRQRLIRL